MDSPLVSAQTVETELNFAYELLTKHWGVNFKKPILCLSDEEIRKFLNLSFLGYYLINTLPPMTYDDTLNRILVSNEMLETHKKYFRIFSFIHEATHALVSQTNHNLTTKADTQLVTSRIKKEKEKANVYLVFDEGLSEYVAINTCLKSGDPKLIDKANLNSKFLKNEFKTLVWSFSMPLLAKKYHKRPKNWQEIIMENLKCYPGIIDRYKYSIGYYFASNIKPTPKNIIKFISNPPTAIKHLLYPEIYLKTLK